MRLARVFAILCSCSTALAQPTDADKKRARMLMDAGDALVAAKEHGRALEKYRAADAIMHVPTTGIEVARTLALLGRLVEAREIALSVTHHPPYAKEPEVFAPARKDAGELAAKLEKRIPTLEVVIKGVPDTTPVSLTIDEQPIRREATVVKLDPGPHQVAAAADGYVPVTRRVDLAEGKTEIVEIVLARQEPAAEPDTPAPPPETRELSPLVFIGFGIAGAGLAVGSVTGILSFKKVSDAKERCDGDECPPAAEDDIDAARTLGTVSTIGFAVALVGAGVGVYGLVSSKRKNERPPAARVQPIVGARYIGVSGRF